MAETQIRLDTQAEDNTLVNSKIMANVITLSKLASIGDGKIIVGAVSTGYPAAVSMAGDVHIDDTGSTTIQSGAVTGAKIASSTITNTNVASGTFSAITGVGTQSQALDMNTHQIHNVTDPSSAQDAATEHYVTSQLGSYLPLAGGTLTGELDIAPSSGPFNPATLLFKSDQGADIGFFNSSTSEQYGEITVDSQGVVVRSKEPNSSVTIRTANSQDYDTNFTFGGDGLLTLPAAEHPWTNCGIELPTQAFIQFDDNGSNSVKVEAPSAVTSSYSLKLPLVQGGASTVLTNDGSGNLSWSASLTTSLPTNDIFVGSLGGVATAVAMSGDVGIDHTGLTTIQANAIVNSKVSATAAIAITKLDTGTNKQIMISNGTTNNWETVSGDITIGNTGVTAIGSGVIVDSEINASANIALSKLADGTNILLADQNHSIADLTRYTYVTAQTFINPGDLVDKAYVDATAVGITVKAPARLATTGHLVATYNNGTNGVGATLTSTTNGALSVDSVAAVATDRILVKDQGTLPLNITGLVSTTEIDVVDNTGVLVGDTIAQALAVNVTLVASGTELDVTDNTGVISGDVINQGSYYATVTSLSAGKIFVSSTTGFTTGAAYDVTQKHYHHSIVTSLGGSTQIFVVSNTGFYTGTGGSPHDAWHIDNGIYTVTTVGDGSNPWVLTRATDFDGSLPEGIVEPGDYVFITAGTLNATSSWIVQDNGFSPITVGMNDITFVQFNAANTYVAGAGMTQVGNIFNVVSANGGIVVDAHDIALTLADSTLAIVAGGLKLHSLTSAHILVGNGSAVATDVAMSGDVTIDNTGVTTVSSSFPRYSSFITREIPTGNINSSNLVYTLAHVPVVGTECVYLNGLLQTVSVDYTISGAVITFTTGEAPETGSILVVNYQK